MDAPSSSRSPAPGRRLRAAVRRVWRRHRPQPPSAPDAHEEPPRRVGSYAQWLPLLRLVPWGLALLFVVSFVWDVPAATLSVAGHTWSTKGLLRILTVSGLIGFGTNWLAITMLFQPRTPRPIFGQGLIPEQRERVAWRLADAVSDELINERIILEKLEQSGLAARYRDKAVALTADLVADPDVRGALKQAARDALRDALAAPHVQERIVQFTEEQLEAHAQQGVPGLALRAYRALREDDFQERLREAVAHLPASVDPLLDELDPLIDRLPAHVRLRGPAIEAALTRAVVQFVRSLNVQRIIRDNVAAYDEQQLERLLKRTTNEQLNYIKYLGAVLGVVGGFIIWAPGPALGVLGGSGLVLYLIDEALYRYRRDS